MGRIETVHGALRAAMARGHPRARVVRRCVGVRVAMAQHPSGPSCASFRCCHRRIVDTSDRTIPVWTLGARLEVSLPRGCSVRPRLGPRRANREVAARARRQHGARGASGHRGIFELGCVAGGALARLFRRGGVCMMCTQPTVAMNAPFALELVLLSPIQPQGSSGAGCDGPCDGCRSQLSPPLHRARWWPTWPFSQDCRTHLSAHCMWLPVCHGGSPVDSHVSTFRRGIVELVVLPPWWPVRSPGQPPHHGHHMAAFSTFGDFATRTTSAPHSYHAVVLVCSWQWAHGLAVCHTACSGVCRVKCGKSRGLG